MKKVVYTILLISLVFLGNIGLYFYSDAYSIFLKQMKYGEDVPQDYTSLITDDYLLKNFSGGDASCSCENTGTKNISSEKTLDDVGEKTSIASGNVVNTPKQTQETEFEKQQKALKKQEVVNKISQILPKFSKYNLVEKPYDEYYKMFDISDEYPNEYLTYSNTDLEMYFFPESTFDSFYNIFTLLSNDVMVRDFELNKVDSFGKKAFFINLVPQDDMVRLVIDNGNILFGLKMKKSYYNDIKNILLQNF
ncbi:MAG: hypothetical protein AB7E37_03610 [Candidatus Altimarinota bacterium]